MIMNLSLLNLMHFALYEKFCGGVQNKSESVPREGGDFFSYVIFLRKVLIHCIVCIEVDIRKEIKA
jgi:hypothetical protein